MAGKTDKIPSRWALPVLFLLVILAAGVWYYTYQTTFIALPYNDAMDYASLARNIARGEGITSAYMTPLGLSIHPYPQPNLWRAPLWPLILGLVLRFFPATDGVVAVTTGFFFLAGLILLYLLALRLADIQLAVTSALIYIFNPHNLHFSSSGMTEPLALFLLLLWIYLLTLDSSHSTRGDYLVGAAGGLFYLARYNGLLFLPLVGFYWWLRRREKGWQPLVRYLGGFLLPTAPWFLRNLYLFGNPIFSLQKFEIPMFTSVHPTYSLYMDLIPPHVLGFIRTYPLALLSKIKGALLIFGGEFLTPKFSGLATVLMILALLALVLPLGQRAKEIHILTVVCLLAQVGALAIIHYIPRLFFIFLPFNIIFGLGALKWILDKLCRGRRVLAAGLLLLSTVLLILANPPQWEEANVYIRLADQFGEPLADLNRLVEEDEVVVSNDGHLVAWYSDRTAVKLPLHPDMLPAMEELAPLRAIFISHRITWNTPEMNVAWWEIFKDPPPRIHDFSLHKVYENGTLVYLK